MSNIQGGEKAKSCQDPKSPYESCCEWRDQSRSASGCKPCGEPAALRSGTESANDLRCSNPLGDLVPVHVMHGAVAIDDEIDRVGDPALLPRVIDISQNRRRCPRLSRGPISPVEQGTRPRRRLPWRGFPGLVAVIRAATEWSPFDVRTAVLRCAIHANRYRRLTAGRQNNSFPHSDAVAPGGKGGSRCHPHWRGASA